MTNKVVVDFETYCEAPIQDVGAWKYSQHPTLDVLCLSYAINDEPTKIWRQYRNDDLPYDLFDAIEDGFQVHAWNVSFEYSVWTNWCIKRGWPDVPIYSWFDTMAKAAAHGLPLGLMNCCIALGLPEEYHKQASGADVLKKFSVPQKDGKRIYPHQVPNLEKVLYDYCVQDTVAERHIGKLLAPLVPFEEDFWHVDFLINRRGIHVDLESSIKIRDKVIVEMAKANDKLPQLTGGLIDRISQTQRIVKFCQASGIKIPDCQAGTVDRILDYVHANPDKVQEKHKPAIEILSTRKWYGKTATSKYDKIIECADDTDRVKFTMVYHGAHTGRWAGRLIQPHNFFKSTINKKCDIDAFVHAVSNRPVECVEAVYQPYIHAAASATRAMLQAPKDKIFYIGDYAAIEARIVFWLCGDDIGLGYYHKGLDPYCKMAEKIYGRVITKEENEHERFIGKGIVLGCLSSDCEVFTDSGWKNILDVKLTDCVFDGTSFVKHGGVVESGIKTCIELGSTKLWLTTEHLVKIAGRWKPALELVGTLKSHLQLKLANVLANGRFWVFGLMKPAFLNLLKFNARAEK